MPPLVPWFAPLLLPEHLTLRGSQDHGRIRIIHVNVILFDERGDQCWFVCLNTLRGWHSIFPFPFGRP